MKTETIPQDLWQRHEMEWQALRAKPVTESAVVLRGPWMKREDDESAEQRTLHRS